MIQQRCVNSPVRTLESTIRDSAKVAKAATNGAIKSLTIEVSVTNGYKAGGTVPIPVVPLEISKTSTTATKLTLNVDVNKFESVMVEGAQEPEILMLDTKTGILSDTSP